jgi:hypothetical protein
MRSLTPTTAFAACVATLILRDQELPNARITLADFKHRFNTFQNDYMLSPERTKLASCMRMLFGPFGHHAAPIFDITPEGIVEFHGPSSPDTLVRLVYRASEDRNKGPRWEALAALALAAVGGMMAETALDLTTLPDFESESGLF